MPGEALGQEVDLPGRELVRQVFQLVADAQVDVVHLDLGAAAEGDPGGGVRHAVTQLDGARPVGRGRRGVREAGRTRGQVGQLLGLRPGRVPLDVAVAGFAVCVHGPALENIYERVGVT